MGFESIIAKIHSLPPLPASVVKLEEAFRQGEPDMKSIVSIIEGDPLLTADILSKVNSPIYGLRNRIVSVMQAVTLFGLGTVRALALKASMDRNFEIDMSPYGLSNEDFAKISAMQNALMFQWYMGVDVERSKIMIPLAFLMETGKVIIAKELTESSYGEVFREMLESNSVDEIEKEFTDVTSAQVSAMLFKHWHFEEIFSILMEHADQEDQIDKSIEEMVLAIQAVRTAINVKEQLSDKSIEAGCMIVTKMGRDSVRFMNATRRVKEKFE
ncbi:HDOD domain-containing protein [Sulfuricurvum sp.]|uniref:HDOD domain-containing protein n=1 Tax=Sulfuricurvum sp. TaxID=2025608 RepID=UPI002613FBEF|nr:HDOD domain-containing protein [Sulfuricurvum sp.]MDD2267542.1 HDOD domain-containing protein [Sulfuricurvum sp.]MDD2784593.1 HDOD domain-containing protein [Sulfuricurvum sp.]